MQGLTLSFIGQGKGWEGGVILADPNNDGLFDPPFWLSHGDVDTAFPKDIWLNVGS